MGRSAKLHKRINKKNEGVKPATSTSVHQPKAAPKPPTAASATQKRRERIKAQAAARKEGEKVLGDVDYVDLMLGGRRKAQEEAKKASS